MKSIIIHKGEHGQRGLKNPICGNVRTKSIIFETSCRYFPSSEDIWDIHKVFGVAVFNPLYSFRTAKNKHWYETHKWQSVRLGFRYNKNNDLIELFLYSYINGGRFTKYLCSVDFFERFEATTYIYKNAMGVIVRKSDGVYSAEEKIGRVFPFAYLRLNARVESGYTPTHDMTIKISNKKTHL